MEKVTDQKTSKLLCSHMIVLRLGREKGARRVAALIEEIARSGATISSHCSLLNGSHVSLDCGTCELRGKVSRCRSWVGGYLTEVDFLPGEEWLPETWKPDRLFNPKSMVCRNPDCRPDCVSESCTTGSVSGGS